MSEFSKSNLNNRPKQHSIKIQKGMHVYEARRMLRERILRDIDKKKLPKGFSEDVEKFLKASPRFNEDILNEQAIKIIAKNARSLYGIREDDYLLIRRKDDIATKIKAAIFRERGKSAIDAVTKIFQNIDYRDPVFQDEHFMAFMKSVYQIIEGPEFSTSEKVEKINKFALAFGYTNYQRIRESSQRKQKRT